MTLPKWATKSRKFIKCSVCKQNKARVTIIVTPNGNRKRKVVCNNGGCRAER